MKFSHQLEPVSAENPVFSIDRHTKDHGRTQVITRTQVIAFRKDMKR